ncbi:MAG: efflux RND transporter periplasmic adaptor subunit [Gammaproteobacteria bacterium]|nr:efflux RND transporter periplasmic adaptor subunit [Gammaproteobacteria bacterium]MBI5617606.1 efflux RND transporter periplasmic adaptor subunit [Gammaproteobacteria bacterium]
MKRLVLLSLVLALLAAGGYWLSRPQPIHVALHAVARGPVRATVANTRVGTVKACARAKMSTSAPGQVASLPVKAGDRVAKDEILLELWNEDLKSSLRQSEAELGTARRRVEEACATAAGAQRDAERWQRLRRNQVVSEEKVDSAVTSAQATAAACAAARATIAAGEARSEVVRQEIEKTRLRAPFAGVVAEVNAKLGEYLTPSPPGIPTLPAVDVIDNTCLYVSAPIDEVDAPAIRPGMAACVTLDAFKEKRCGARVRRVAPYVLEQEKQSRTVEVEVEFGTAADLAGLMPGYSADIEILLDEHADVLRVPTEAVIEGHRVLVYDAARRRLAERRFEPGLANWEYTEAASGLAAGDRIVLSIGREGVEDGAAALPEDAR